MATAGAQTAPGGHHGSDLQALAAMLTRQKWVIIAVTLAGAVLGLALTAFSAKVYEGTALLSVRVRRRTTRRSSRPAPPAAARR